MTISRGTAKVVSYKKESAWGTLAGNTGGKQLRRVTSAFNLVKDSYESGEIRTDRQVADFRHGVRSAEGSLSGELSSASYADFMAAILAKNFATAPAATGLSLTIAASSNLWTVTRSSGSYITDGFSPGMVVRLTAAGFNAANVAKNLVIVTVTTTVLTVSVLNGSALTAEGPIASASVTAVGKTSFVPASGHTDDSFTFEEWYSDIAQSEVYTGCKTNSMNVQLPSTGLATIDFGFVGKDLTQKGTSQYFTSPTAQGTTGIFAAVNGVMILNGAPIALVTSADFTVERATENAVAVGSNSIAEVFTGRIRVSGNMSVYFQDAAIRNLFDTETPVSVAMTLAETSAADSNFVSFVIPKIKLGSFSKDDGELGLVASTSFQALLNDVTTGGLPATTILVQDSAA